jgi:hypothetical protein
MKDESRPVLPIELRRASAKLVLNSDGTFVASDLPGFLYLPEHRSARLENGSGVWKLSSREGKRQLQLDFQTIADWTGPLPYGTQLDISKGNLLYFFGDADEGRKVSFEKK